MAVIHVAQTPVDTRDVYTTESEIILVNGGAALGAPNTYFASIGDTVSISLELHKDGAIDEGIDSTLLGYPPALKMPVVKMAGGMSGVIVDEIYFNVTIIEGVLTATGDIPSSGAWMLIVDRLNKSLQSISATWKVSRANLTILV